MLGLAGDILERHSSLINMLNSLKPALRLMRLCAKMVEQLEFMQTQAIQDGDAANSRVASFFCNFETTESNEGEQEGVQEQDFQHLSITLHTLALQNDSKGQSV